MPSTTSFLMVKAHAYNAKAPSEDQIKAMLNAPTIGEIENILNNTHYDEILQKVRPSVSLTDFEVELKREYARILTLYQRAATPDLKRLLNAYSLVIEADNMNVILQAILANNVSEQLLESIIPVGKFGMPHYKRMMETTKVEIASDFIIDPTLRSAVQQALQLSDSHDEQTFLLSSALSHTSFHILQKEARNWVQSEIEFLNLQTVCRGINLGIDPKPWLIPNAGIINKYESTLSNMTNVRDVLVFLLPHFTIKQPLRIALNVDDDKIITSLEDSVELWLNQKHKRNFMININRKESILDFFAMKRAEIQDISRILLGTAKGVPTETIESMITWPIYS